jgi:hypothetical protein
LSYSQRLVGFEPTTCRDRSICLLRCGAVGALEEKPVSVVTNGKEVAETHAVQGPDNVRPYKF